MKEAFLHFVWRFQYFDKKELKSECGEKVEILSTGNYNTDSGPDFLNAKVKIGKITWVGNIELHINASSWYSHNHQKDPAYENVILHVVWQNDRAIYRKDGSVIPSIALKDKIEKGLLIRYAAFLVTDKTALPCKTALKAMPSIIKISMLEKALMERLKRKADEILERNEKNKGDWEETCYQQLCSNFGFKINSAPFLRLSGALPFKLLKKHKDKLSQIEALLFGQSGFLERSFSTHYLQELQKEYSFLSHKYALEGTKLKDREWKFLRLRPANFPTLRLAQLASILQKTDSVYSLLVEAEKPEAITRVLASLPSGYWKNHFTFEKEIKNKENKIGKESLVNIVINSAVPLMVAVGEEKGQQELIEKAVWFLTLLPAENNRIIRNWAAVGVEIKDAADSQGSIELFNCFCKNRLCLNCNIGHAVIKPR